MSEIECSSSGCKENPICLDSSPGSFPVSISPVSKKGKRSKCIFPCCSRKWFITGEYYLRSSIIYLLAFQVIHILTGSHHIMTGNFHTHMDLLLLYLLFHLLSLHLLIHLPPLQWPMIIHHLNYIL